MGIHFKGSGSAGAAAAGGVRTAPGRAKKRGGLARFLKDYSYLLSQLAVFGVSVLVSSASILGELSPFGIALAAAMPTTHLLWCVTGVVSGYVFLNAIDVGLLYTAAVLITVAFRWVLAHREEASARWPGVISAGFGVVLSRLALSGAMGLTGLNLAVIASEGMLAMGMCYFFTITIEAFQKQKSIRSFSNLQLASLLICLSVGLISLSAVQVLGLSLGRVTAAVLTITAAYLGKEAYGSVTGVLTALAVSLAAPEMLLFMGAYPLGGLVSGLFSRQSKVLGSVAYGVCCTMMATLLPQQSVAPAFIIEWFLGCALFLLIPSKLLGALPLGQGADSMVKSERVKKIVGYKLRATAGGLETISHKIQTLYKRLDELQTTDPSCVYHAAADQVCKNCGLCPYCWDQNYSETSDCLGKGVQQLQATGRLNGTDLPLYFAKRCIRLGSLVDAMTDQFAQYQNNQAVVRKLSYVKGGVIGQMESLSKLLYNVSEQVDALEDVDMQSSKQIYQLLMDMGFAPLDVLCTTSEVKGAKIELKLDCDITEKQRAYIGSELSEYCDRNFDSGVCRQDGEATLLCYSELPPMVLKKGSCQIAAGRGHCGDSFEVFGGEDGYSYCILSDGMGTGDFAAIDSTMTCNVVSTVLKAGFDVDGSIDLINSALAVKTGDETISTIDLLRFDCFTGDCLLVKGGSPNTYVLRGGKVLRLGKPSLPIGILQSVTLDKSQVRLRVGDVLLMVSDGAVGEDETFISRQLALLRDKEPQEIATAICELARHSIGSKDDITAICFKVEKGA